LEQASEFVAGKAHTVYTPAVWLCELPYFTISTNVSGGVWARVCGLGVWKSLCTGAPIRGCVDSVLLASCVDVSVPWSKLLGRRGVQCSWYTHGVVRWCV
jgi:hypothetical protein